MTNNQFTFQTEGLQFSEAIVKGEKKYYVEGFISTTDEDLSGEVLTSEAQDHMLKQLNEREITLDYEHEEWYDEKERQLSKPKSNMIPIGKVVKAERKYEPKNGVYVKVELNSNLKNKFETVWGSIKDGFVKAFSVAFFPVESVTKYINGKMKSWISKLNLVNITLTGSPINPNATFVPVMKAALKSMKSEQPEEQTMDSKENVEEKSEPEEQKKDKVVEEKQPEVKESPEEKEEVKEESPKVEEKAPEPKPEKVEAKEPKPKPEPKQEKKVEAPQKVDAKRPLDLIKAEKKVGDLKAENDELKEEIAKLKAQLEQPMLKGKQTETPNLKGVVKPRQPLDIIQ